MAVTLTPYKNWHEIDARVVDKITGAWSSLPWFMMLDKRN